MSSSWAAIRDPASAFPTASPSLPSSFLQATFCHYALRKFFFSSFKVLVTGSVLPHFNFPFHVIAGKKVFHLHLAIYRDFFSISSESQGLLVWFPACASCCAFDREIPLVQASPSNTPSECSLFIPSSNVPMPFVQHQIGLLERLDNANHHYLRRLDCVMACS